MLLKHQTAFRTHRIGLHKHILSSLLETTFADWQAVGCFELVAGVGIHVVDHLLLRDLPIAELSGMRAQSAEVYLVVLHLGH